MVSHARANTGDFYEVVYDIDVQVPRGARTVISTVNRGDIRLEGLNGNFDVKNVNGGIAMQAIGGSGDAHTVNGPVAIHFAKNPSGPCSFKSVNGSLDAYLPERAFSGTPVQDSQRADLQRLRRVPEGDAGGTRANDAMESLCTTATGCPEDARGEAVRS